MAKSTVLGLAWCQVNVLVALQDGSGGDSLAMHVNGQTDGFITMDKDSPRAASRFTTDTEMSDLTESRK